LEKASLSGRQGARGISEIIIVGSIVLIELWSCDAKNGTFSPLSSWNFF